MGSPSGSIEGGSDERGVTVRVALVRSTGGGTSGGANEARVAEDADEAKGAEAAAEAGGVDGGSRVSNARATPVSKVAAGGAARGGLAAAGAICAGGIANAVASENTTAPEEGAAGGLLGSTAGRSAGSIPGESADTPGGDAHGGGVDERAGAAACAIAAVTVLTPPLSAAGACAAPQWMQKRVADWLSLPHVGHCMSCVPPRSSLREPKRRRSDASRESCTKAAAL
jgi:hypothetical protein